MAESNGSNGTVETAVATAAVKRKRSVTRDDYATGSVIHFMVPTYGFWGQGAKYSMLPANLPAYNRYAFFTSRDTTLLMTRHYEALWAAALYTAVSKMSSAAWEIESGVPLRRKRAQLVLQMATAGAFRGWVHFLQAHLTSFLNTGYAVVEIERETKAYGRRVTALHHLNPLRCRITDNPEIPILYTDRKMRVHEMKYHDVLVFGDMVDPTLGEYGMVQSAAERSYQKIRLLSVIERFIWEKVSGNRALSLEFIQGLTETTLSDAIESSEMDQKRRGAIAYKGAVVVPIPGDVPIQRVSIPLAEIPDGFDYRALVDDANVNYANNIGLDVNDVDPRLASRQSFGSGAQSLILHEKSKGQGLESWKTQWTNNANFWIFDTATKFVFSESSLDDELKKTQVQEQRTAVHSAQIEKGIITAEQAKNLLVDAGDLPREFLDKDVTAGTTISDDDKPIEQQAEQKPDQAVPVPETPEQQERTKARVEDALERVRGLMKQEEGTAVELARGGGAVAEATAVLQRAKALVETA